MPCFLKIENRQDVIFFQVFMLERLYNILWIPKIHILLAYLQ